ncbi:MAG TPA: DPP IV N-terminal domain-containing protein [Allosphingosinicella sp.]|jgi:dipeptidyl-peptidase-4
MRIALFASLLLATAAVPAAAEDLTLERVFQSPSLSGPAPRSLKLSPDGRFATLLRNRADDKERYDLWAVDTATGEARMLVDSLKLGTGAEVSEEEKMRRERLRIAGTKGITAYQWAPDGKSILVPLEGDLYLASLDGSVRRMTETEQTELDAQVSETSRFLSFVRDQDLFVADAASGAERQLTQGGEGPVSWGSAEFVAQEEMGRREGHWWSPDDRWIAVARVDETPVKVVTRAAIGAEGTKLYEQRYPVAGSANALVELWVMAPDGSRRVKADLGSDPDIYLARVDWTEDGKALLVQRQSRDQKRLDVLRVDPATGKSQLLFSETSKTWINLHDNLKPLKDGSILWASERSGFQHLYLWKKGKWRQLTRGDWEVADVAGVDEKKRRVFFTGTLDNPDAQNLYWVSLDKPGKPVRVTEAGWNNSAEMDEEATRVLISRSNPNQPNQVYLADANGKRIAWIEENRLDANHPYAPFLDSHVTAQFGTLPAADGTPIPYKMLSPKREAGKRYPVLVQVYAGPSGGQVMQGWTSPLHQYLVDRGWIVFSVDGRGTARRGRAFADQLHLKLGGVEVEDQLAGLKWLKGQSFVDPGKVGVYGWSYGGYMVLRLLEAAPGAYAAGVAGAPVTKWELYDTHYTERYLGNPALDAKPYEASSVLTGAAKIADPLLLLHGMADDNVVFENSTAMIAALQDAKKPFELMVYPGATHAVTGEARQTHLWTTIESFLDRRVKEAR